MPTWQPLSWSMGPDLAEYIRGTWPSLYVDATSIRGEPTKDDPLGAKPKLVIHYNSDDMTFKFQLFADCSPWLKPDAVEAYLYIHWPEYFRRGSNGQAPE